MDNNIIHLTFLSLFPTLTHHHFFLLPLSRAKMNTTTGVGLSGEVAEHSGETTPQKGDNPKGFDQLSEPELVKEIRNRHSAARMASAPWRKMAQKCYDYVSGNQAPSESDFYIVFNQIMNRFLTQVGILTVGKPTATVFARGVDDFDAGAVMKDLLEYYADKSKVTKKLGLVVNDRITCGLGVMREVFDTNQMRWTTRHGYMPGEMDVLKMDPLEYAFPPNNTEEEMVNNGGPRYYTKVSKISRDTLMMLYPKKKNEIGRVAVDALKDPEGDGDGLYGRDQGTYSVDDSRSGSYGDQEPKGTDELISVEYWYRKSIPVDAVVKITKDATNEYREYKDFAYLPDWDETQEEEYPHTKYGEPGALIDPKNIPDPEKLYGAEVGKRTRFENIRHIQTQVWCAEIVGDVLLYHHQSMYRHNRYPDLFLAGQFRKKRNEPHPYGTVEGLIAPQDLFNSGMTMLQDNAARLSNAGKVVLPHNIIQEQRDRIPDILNQPGWLLVADETAQSADDVLKEFPAGALPVQYIDVLNFCLVDVR